MLFSSLLFDATASREVKSLLSLLTQSLLTKRTLSEEWEGVLEADEDTKLESPPQVQSGKVGRSKFSSNKQPFHLLIGIFNKNVRPANLKASFPDKAGIFLCLEDVEFEINLFLPCCDLQLIYEQP